MYTTKEIAKMFKVSERTVKKWISDGDMKVVRVGGTVRISEEELDRLKRGE